MPGDERIFRLFACCVPVRGARRSVICDLQRQRFRFIPNGLYEILTVHAGQAVAAVKEAYGRLQDRRIDDYFAFLLEHDLGFWCDEPEAFPDLDLTWRAPERITNAIVDFAADSRHDLALIVEQLDDLGCKALQLRFFSPRSLAEVSELLAPTEGSRLRSVDLLLAWTAGLEAAAFAALCARHPRVLRLAVHSAPEDLVLPVPGSHLAAAFHRQEVSSPACCGEVHPGYFTVNLETMSEARHFNSCLNRKIAIDSRGEIKNCPSMARSFGNIRQVSLHGALAQRDFRALWAINKDQIEVCKDCEFRYICTDCRAYLDDPADLYSKPAKCTYNPYEASWG